ncbi:DMT family transporter [Paenibacillus sp. Marseille-Q4541]|uniref:DMT family transporter n=1 Tax=Paenibacillus sp. Marseille-Q4541 TaxID=2831522 RepID=UPI001BAD8807|nr:DMT family transporter [Paenibacillus sp. Marseille-Q4541]
MNIQRIADLQMLLVTLLWGSSYLFMKEGLGSVQEINLIALRFGFAFLLLGILFYRKWSCLNWKLVGQGFLLGAVLFTAFIFITYGVKRTSTSQAGFLISLSVVFVPLLTAVWKKQLPSKKMVVCIMLAVTGISLLTLDQSLSIGSGDILCILGALMYAVYIILSGFIVKNGDAILLSILQLGFAGGIALIFSFIFEQPRLPDTNEAWVAVLGLTVLCSAVAYTLQILAQRHMTSTRAGLIFSMEPVFAAGFALMFYGEKLPWNGWVGACFILSGVLLTEITPRLPQWIRKQKRTEKVGV